MLALKILRCYKHAHKFQSLRSAFEHATIDCNGFYDVLLRSVVTVYCVLREHIVEVYFSRLQCIWKLTDE